MNRELQKRIAAWRDETIALAGVSDEVRRLMFGSRTSRKERAPSDATLAKPTKAQIEVARKMVDNGQLVHTVEQYWAKRGIRMTRNRMSRLKGAVR